MAWMEAEEEPQQAPERQARRNRVYCRSCGASERVRGDSFPLGWSIMGSSNERITAVCSDCSRRYLRDIEGKLDLDFELGFE